MFSFFKKKPVPAPVPAPTAAASSEGPATAPTGADAQDASAQSAPSGERPRSKLDWLHADVGELFFGKKAAPPAPAPPIERALQPPPGVIAPTEAPEAAAPSIAAPV